MKSERELWKVPKEEVPEALPNGHKAMAVSIDDELVDVSSRRALRSDSHDPGSVIECRAMRAQEDPGLKSRSRS